jgi:hypothetical protein
MADAAITNRVSGICRKTRVARQQHGVGERLCQRQVEGIVGGEVVPQLPHASAEWRVRVEDQAHLAEFRDRAICLRSAHSALAQEPPNRVEDLRLDQLRSMKRFIQSAGQLPCDGLDCSTSAEQELNQNRRVNDDQCVSRSSRISGATGGPAYGSRSEIRAASSINDGLPASSAFDSLIVASIVLSITRS